MDSLDNYTGQYGATVQRINNSFFIFWNSYLDSHILKDDFTKSAHVHAVELGLKEAVFTDNSKCHGIQQLLEINFGYRIFNNHFREEK